MSAVQLQGIGQTNAKVASDFVVGETMVWNYGIASKVVAVCDASKMFLSFELLGGDGKTYTRRIKKDRLVGCA